MNSTNFWDRYTRAFTGVPRPKLISGIGIVYNLGPGTPVHARVYLSRKLDEFILGLETPGYTRACTGVPALKTEIFFLDLGLPRVHLRF